MPENATRPAVSVVVPFAGDAADAGRLVAALGALRLRQGDELVVADNSRLPVVQAAAGPGIRVVRAEGEGSPAHARNRGAAVATGEWLLFMDADCEPDPELVDAYFNPPPGPRTAALAGAIRGLPTTRFAARWAEARRYLDQRTYLEAPVGPGAITPNLLVRRKAFEQAGGFTEGIYSGEDLELSWRLADAGYEIGYRAGAVVAHRHRESIREALAQARRCGAGNAWQNRVRPGSSPEPRPLREAARAVARSGRSLARGNFDEARFALMDGAIALARARGYREPNDAAPLGGRG